MKPPPTSRISAWDSEIGRLFDIPERPFATEIEAAVELVILLERRGFPSMARHEKQGWFIHFFRRACRYSEGELIGDSGATVPQAIAKAAVKLGNLLRLEEAMGTLLRLEAAREP